MWQLSLTYLAFPHGTYPKVELLCNRVCSSFNRIGSSVWHICGCPKYSEHPSYIAVTFPHYNSYLFKASFRKILQLLLQFMCRHVTWVLPIRCIRERLQFRRQHHENRNTMQNYVNEGDRVWPKNELLELNVTKVLATVCCAQCPHEQRWWLSKEQCTYKQCGNVIWAFFLTVSSFRLFSGLSGDCKSSDIL